MVSLKPHLDSLLNAWHQAAAKADLKTYFSLMDSSCIFIGTDAGEYWNDTAFLGFCRPYFEKGKAWTFKPLQRHLYVSPQNGVAWFDEVLDTQMKLCRGSGVLREVNGQWKIVHYVLSMTIPNACTKTIVPIKTPIEDSMIQIWQQRPLLAP